MFVISFFQGGTATAEQMQKAQSAVKSELEKSEVHSCGNGIVIFVCAGGIVGCQSDGGERSGPSLKHVGEVMSLGSASARAWAIANAIKQVRAFFLLCPFLDTVLTPVGAG